MTDNRDFNKETQNFNPFQRTKIISRGTSCNST
jgi:hypothetical protein